MARISINIEAESAGDLHAELEQLLRGNRYGRQAANDSAADSMVLTQVSRTDEPATVGGIDRSPQAGWVGGTGGLAQYMDDRRAETVEAITGNAGDDLKPVRGKNADDLAAKLIAEPNMPDWREQYDRLPKKHQEQVVVATAPETGTAATVVTADGYLLVGAKGATIAVHDTADKFVAELGAIAAKLGRRSDIVALAAANSAVVKTLPATGQSTLEAAFRAALEAAIDDTRVEVTPTTEKPAEATEAARAPTIDDVRAAVTDIANKLGMEAGRKVVVDTGKAAKISEIDAADYQAVLDECKRLKAG